MSLGFNTNRPLRTGANQMLGSITNTSFIPISKPSKQVSSAPRPSLPSPIPLLQNEPKTDNLLQRRIELLEGQVKRLTESRKETELRMPEDVYTVYGIAEDTVCDSTGASLAKKGDAVKLIYPMKKEEERTVMRLMVVDVVTAQLSYHWIPVFEMVDGKPKRNVSHFSHSAPWTSSSNEDSCTLSVVT